MRAEGKNEKENTKMNMKMGIEAALRICFLLFLLSASWQDLKKKTIKRSSFLIWGTVGVILQAAHIFSQIFMGTEKMGMQVIVQEVTGLMLWEMEMAVSFC